ncbi:MAG TPA: hypothetical protein VFT45_07830 [Longimicrobium sp.]|nr:hypothetical protein [Longimicrobium sp.]
MGASAWVCFTAWTDDAEAALQRLRQETFLSGDYYGGSGALSGGEDNLSEDDREQVRKGMERLKNFLGFKPWELTPWEAPPGETIMGEEWKEGRGPSGSPPRGVDEAVARAGVEGTHSILDITHTTRFFQPRAAAPLPESLLLRHLGTQQPERAQVEDAFGDVAEELDRWECVYLAVYRDGAPHELAFIGVTGD